MTKETTNEETRLITEETASNIEPQQEVSESSNTIKIVCKGGTITVIAAAGTIPYLLTMIKALRNAKQSRHRKFDIAKMTSVVGANLLLNIFSADASITAFHDIKENWSCKPRNILRIVLPIPFAAALTIITINNAPGFPEKIFSGICSAVGVYTLNIMACEAIAAAYNSFKKIERERTEILNDIKLYRAIIAAYNLQDTQEGVETLFGRHYNPPHQLLAMLGNVFQWALRLALALLLVYVGLVIAAGTEKGLRDCGVGNITALILSQLCVLSIMLLCAYNGYKVGSNIGSIVRTQYHLDLRAPALDVKRWFPAIIGGILIGVLSGSSLQEWYESAAPSSMMRDFLMCWIGMGMLANTSAASFNTLYCIQTVDQALQLFTKFCCKKNAPENNNPEGILARFEKRTLDAKTLEELGNTRKDLNKYRMFTDGNVCSMQINAATYRPV